MLKISLLGLYTYSNHLFDKLTLPVFDAPEPSPDKDTLIALILEKSAEFSALYPDYDFMYFMCEVWSKNCEYMMTHLWKTMTAEYNPIHNYDRTSKISRKANSSGGGTVTASSTAFNTDSFKETGKQVSTETASGGETIEENVSGNIGVLSSQSMLEQERTISNFKWYDVVADDFISKFCVMIY